jgi:uncharacterized Zn-binding protein involved in type VI secretion
MMHPAARLTDDHACPSGTGPINEPGATTVVIDGKIASKLADYIDCPWHSDDVVAEGSATVLWEQLPATLEGCHTLVLGVIQPPCSSTVIIGGPTFALPENIEVFGTHEERNKIVRDLYLLWTTPSGKELFRRLTESGKVISIYTTPNPGAAGAKPWNMWPLVFGFGVGSTVYYNPDGQIAVYDRNGQPISCPPQIVLGHELSHSLDMADGTLPILAKDPNPPLSEPNIPLAESRAIGTGSGTGRVPSENSFRRDLGLPERDNHFGSVSNAGSGPTNLRPGK